MNWFKSKPKEEPKKVEVKPTINKELEYERVMNNLSTEIAKIEGQIDAKEVRMDKLDKEIRALVSQKKNAQAKTKLQELKMIREEMTNLDNKKMAMVKMKLKTEQSRSDNSSAAVMKDVNTLLKADEKTREELSDHILDWQEYAQGQEEMKNMWSQLAGTEDTNVDDELADYIKQDEMEKATQVAGKFDQIPKANIGVVSNQNAYVAPAKQDPFAESLLENPYKI